MSDHNLTIVPTVDVWTDGNLLNFDRKFYDGILMYLEYWEGSIKCIMRKSIESPPEFGLVKKKIDELPFALTILNRNEDIKLDHIKNATIVLAAGGSSKQLHLSKLCQRKKIKCVYIVENLLEMRYRVIDLQTKNHVIRLYRKFRAWNAERKRVLAFRLANGIQANGAAAFEEYSKFGNCVLYFDTRVNKELIINDEELDSRLKTLAQKRPLRLAFSGRLLKIKGADHLTPLSIILRERNINFELTIYGSGELENSMRDNLIKMQLAEVVRMPGAVEFYSELIPSLKSNFDIFVMLHRQPDPSCTYLETLSCGVPIVSYENKAFSGILKRADIGWGAAVDDLMGIADIIERLNNDRNAIAEKARNSAIFARKHDFETTFRNRIEHLRKIVE